MTSSLAVRRCAALAVRDVLEAYAAPVVAFDTETTGLRGVVVQAAWVKLDGCGREVDSCCVLLGPPPGHRVEPGALAVHGLSDELLAREGVSADALVAFVRRLRAEAAIGARLVAHNKAFDVARLAETLRAHGLEDERPLAEEEVLCTMRTARERCGLRNAAGRPRYPKNAELYEILAGEPVEERFGRLHDALADARVTAHAYVHGRRVGWW